MKSFLLATSLLCTFAHAQKWSFVVAGDGRSDPGKNRPEDLNGLNKTITEELAKAVLAEKAKFLLWTGDLVLGAKDAKEHEKQLMTWRGIMEPLYNSNIRVLACRGNHEANSKDSVAVWNRVFTGKYSMPLNGPRNEKNFTFFYGKGDVLICGLDQYTVGKEKISQGWLDQTLAKYPKPFVFTFGHEPAFMDGAHKDTLDANPGPRNDFWNSLINSGSRVYFAGHDHLYDHMVVQRDSDTPGPEMHQLIAGTAGAPFYKKGDYEGDNKGWKLARANNIVNKYGYILVEIDGMRATVSFKGRTAPGVYEVMDSFSYTATVR